MIVFNKNSLSDIDAISYLSRVMEADGQPLEYAVQLAVNNFVVNCKAATIWNAIKSCCILMGARTLAGALVPLVGPAPTNFNFVSADYNRKTGLLSDGTTKHLDSNFLASSQPQNDFHMSVGVSEAGTIGPANRAYMGTAFSANPGQIGASVIMTTPAGDLIFRNRSSAIATGVGAASNIGFIGNNRQGSGNIVMRYGGVTSTPGAASDGNFAGNMFVFSRFENIIDARLYFYSIGAIMNLNSFDTITTTLRNDIAAAIP